MRTSVRSVAAELLSLFLLVGSSALAQEAAPLHVRIVATHDLHGALLPTTSFSWSNGRPIGGVDALKAAVDSLKADCPCPSFWLDGGDQMQGTLESNLVRGASVVAAFNYIGLDAAAIGNHELDWGVDTFASRESEAHYAWLAANVFRVDNGERPSWAEPFTVMDRDGVRVGVVGYATTSTPATQLPERTKPYEFRGGYAGIRQALDEVWKQQPDFVVVVAHAGGQCDAEGCGGEMVDLASQLPPGRVHLIVGGHTHSPGEGVVNSIPIIRAGSSGRAVASVDLYRLSGGAHAFTIAVETVYADTAAEDRGLTELLAPYAAQADAIGKQQVTTLAEPLSASRGGDRQLGYFIADSLRLLAKADFGLEDPGGVRMDLPSGPITYADVLRVLPFDDNMVVRVTLTGRQLRQLVEQAGPTYYFSNLKIEFNRADRRVDSLTFADGTPLTDERPYSLATHTFLANGGDGFEILVGLPRQALGISILDAVVNRLRELPAPVSLPLQRQ